MTEVAVLNKNVLVMESLQKLKKESFMINLEKEEEKKRKKTLEIHKRKIEEIINN